MNERLHSTHHRSLSRKKISTFFYHVLIVIVLVKDAPKKCCSFSPFSSTFSPLHMLPCQHNGRCHHRLQSQLSFSSLSSPSILPSLLVMDAKSTKNGANSYSDRGSSASTSTNEGSKSKPSITITSYEEAMEIIDQCSKTSSPSDNLYDAVKYIDRNANTLIYPNVKAREDMWSNAFGSWKLVLATGGGRYTTFKPIPKPLFAFARIDEVNFGNGIGLNEDVILLSLLGPHEFGAKRRQMKICIDDMYITGKNVTNALPKFISAGMLGLGKRPGDYSGKKGDRIPAFTIIASSESSLVARGGTGGVAIWTRLKKDIQTAAYSS